jgi:hypothetical protein
MKVLTTVLGLLAVGVGILSQISPDVLVRIGRTVVTPTGLYVIAFVRVCIGLMLILVARTSRMPKTVRILGCIALIAGIVTPLFGVDRSVAVLNWWTAQGPVVGRLPGLVLAAVGVFMIYAIASGRRHAA